MSISWDKNLRNRLIVGFIGGPLILFISFVGQWYFFGLLLLMLLLGVAEMQLMGSSLGFSNPDIPGYLFSFIIILDFYLFAGSHLLIILICYFSVLFLDAVIRYGENQLFETSFRCLSTLYPSIFLSSLLLVREYEFSSGYNIGGKLIITIFLSIWFLDTLAYFSGKAFGKHPLFPQVSPKKTIEGGIGGFISAIAAVLLVKYVFFQELSFFHGIMLGAVIGVLGQLGDMFESFIKRKANIKDSSSILPGHGGILDRFDSLIFVSPFVYYYIVFIINDI
ncbi:phosphatidate cytidylyltransferase [candidate division KSB1 bacterium]